MGLLKHETEIASDAAVLARQAAAAGDTSGAERWRDVAMACAALSMHKLNQPPWWRHFARRRYNATLLRLMRRVDAAITQAM